MCVHTTPPTALPACCCGSSSDVGYDHGFNGMRIMKKVKCKCIKKQAEVSRVRIHTKPQTQKNITPGGVFEPLRGAQVSLTLANRCNNLCWGTSEITPYTSFGECASSAGKSNRMTSIQPVLCRCRSSVNKNTCLVMGNTEAVTVHARFLLWLGGRIPCLLQHISC